MHHIFNKKSRAFRPGIVVRLLFTGRADIKNDMLSLQSISGKHNQTPKEWSCQSETGGNFLEQIQFSGGDSWTRTNDPISFEKVLRGNPHCTFAVNFRCYPLFYDDAAADITVTTSGTIITNPGSVYSEPILTVTGSGNITLMVGMAIVELENISGSIVIDSVLQEAYQGTTLMNDHMNGEFPVLKPGANAISWTGTVTKVVVRPNWRSL